MTQTTKSDTYVSGPCKCGKCSAYTKYRPCQLYKGVKDWNVGDVKCCGGFCTSQDRCAKIDLTQCSIGNSSTGKPPLADVSWNGKAPAVRCKFALKDIDSYRQVNNYINKFGINDQLMGNFCGQMVSQCPNKGNCSRLKSTAPGANLCRNWYEKQPAASKDSFMQNYCINTKTYDCNCVNRSDDPIYQELKQAKVINDGCWYTPCANPSKFFVPSQLLHPKCPKNVCDIIFQFIKDKRIDIDDVKNEINCNFGPDPGPSPGPGSNYIWIIIGVVILGLLILKR